MAQTHLQQLVSKPVTRTQFLKIMGLLVLSVFGASTIIHFFTGKHPADKLVASVTPPRSYGRN